MTGKGMIEYGSCYSISMCSRLTYGRVSSKHDRNRKSKAMFRTGNTENKNNNTLIKRFI